jgi:hypothetical protein
MFAIHRRRISGSTLFATLPPTDRAHAEIVPPKIDASGIGSGAACRRPALMMGSQIQPEPTSVGALQSVGPMAKPRWIAPAGFWE